MDEPIVIAGGGTAGHVIPALAVVKELRRRMDIRVRWIGSGNGPERVLVRRAGIEFRAIPAGKLRRYFSVRNAVDALRIVAGWVASLALLLSWRPKAVFSKGGFVTVPVLAAARLLGIPMLSHESDTTPGLATLINARLGARILVSFDSTVAMLPAAARGRAVVTGNPVREEMLRADPARGKALVGCPVGRQLLVVTGGSQGARGINRLLEGCLEELLERAFVVHQHGPVDPPSASVIGGYYGARYIEEGFGDVLAAADLVVCRAGANNLMELAALRKPSILVPLPRSASRGDQIENARLFAALGAGVCLEQDGLSSADLAREITGLLADRGRLSAMAQCAGKLARPMAAGKIADAVVDAMGVV